MSKPVVILISVVKWTVILFLIGLLGNYLVENIIPKPEQPFSPIQQTYNKLTLAYYCIAMFVFIFAIREIYRKVEKVTGGNVYILGFSMLLLTVCLRYAAWIYMGSKYTFSINETMLYGSIETLLILLAVFLYATIWAAMWGIFVKCGYKGWYALIPFVNLYYLCKVANQGDLFIVTLIPIINIGMYWIILNGVAAKFGKSGNFGAGLFFLPFIFYPILGFGDTEPVNMEVKGN